VTTENAVYNTDLLSLCAQLEPASVDMILCDLPYGTTACSWDTVIPFAPMWDAFRRIVKPRAAIVLTASQPFTSALVMSNPSAFKYEWIWHKAKGINFLHAKNMPIKTHESVLVFSDAPIGHHQQLGAERMNYNPQGLVRVNARWHRPKQYPTEHRITRPSNQLDRIIEFSNYPTSVIQFDNSDNRERGHHPTQKPVDLFRYLIRTYTRPGDLVVDPCVGSGTTALAARAEGRRYIVGDSSAEYCEVARKRLDAPYTLPMLGLFAEEGA
jgi:site-specific DNA-methyltransferase (adenine-specific)